MEININKIVSADELSVDTNLILERLGETSEIFVFENNHPQFVIMSLDSYYSRPNQQTVKIISVEDPSKEKIGKLVQESLRKLFYKQRLPQDEIERLTSEEYSKTVFNLNFPVLKEYNSELAFDEQKRDAKGYNRYYSFTLSAYNKQYLVCSQWIEHLHREQYETWLSRWENENSSTN